MVLGSWASHLPHQRGAAMNIDSIIERLVAAKNARPGTPVQLTEREAAVLVAAAEETISRSPMLLELEAPLQIVGDIHGQFVDLLRLFEFKGLPPNANYLFLGDYVDRGPSGLECMFLLMALKVKHPENVHLLRGNHECAAINRIYGFYDECKRRYSIKLWKSFQDLFNTLPLAAVIEQRIFCIHGGLSPDMESPDDLKKFNRCACMLDRPVACASVCPPQSHETPPLLLTCAHAGVTCRCHDLKRMRVCIDRWKCRTRDCYATRSGPTPTRISPAGLKTTAACHLRLVPMLSPNFWRATTST